MLSCSGYYVKVIVVTTQMSLAAMVASSRPLHSIRSPCGGRIFWRLSESRALCRYATSFQRPSETNKRGGFFLIRSHPKRRPIRIIVHMQLVHEATTQLGRSGAVLQALHFATSQGVLVWPEITFGCECDSLGRLTRPQVLFSIDAWGSMIWRRPPLQCLELPPGPQNRPPGSRGLENITIWSTAAKYHRILDLKHRKLCQYPPKSQR